MSAIGPIHMSRPNRHTIISVRIVLTIKFDMMADLLGGFISLVISLVFEC